MNFINFIVDNWPFLILGIVAISVGIKFLYNFFKNPSAQQLESIKQWAIYACAMAEAALGSGTGQLKMRATYDMFLNKFPALAKIVPFEKYKQLAESALMEFKKMLKENPNVQDLVVKEDTEDGNNEN